MESSQTGKKVMNSFFWRLFERIGAKGVELVVSLVLANLLDPELFGSIALVLVVITILQVFVDSGLGNALIQKKDSDNKDFSTVFFFNIVFCAVLYTLLFFASPFFARFYDDPSLTPIIRVLGLTVVISGVKNVQVAYVSKTLQFKRFFFSTLGGTIFAAVAGIYMAFKGYGMWALVVQSVSNTAIDTIILWITVKWKPEFYFSFKRLKVLFAYGWKLLVSQLLDTGYNQLRSLIIGKKYTKDDLAYYDRANQFPGFITANINTSIDSVLFPAMSGVQDDKARVKSMTKRAMKTSIFLMAPMMAGLACCARPIVKLVLNETWLPLIPYMIILCISYTFYPLHTANLNAIKALGRSDKFLILEIIKKTIGITLLLISMWYGVMAITLSMLVSDIICQVINSWPNKKLIDYGYFEQLKDILPSIILAWVMGGIVYSVSLLGLNDLITLIIQVPLGVAIYTLGAKIFKMESFDYLLDVIKSIIGKKEKTT
ncbi:MAG: lipopolysaccharide biosynthesis protein [Clostridiales bacterium]|nr:lipopolysaccharide biosynthesis protein [Clostridiales bacterium]